MVGRLKSIIRLWEISHPESKESWHLNLPKIANVINKTINSFGVSSEIVMFGIENASLSPVNYDNDFDSVEDYVKYIKDHLKTTHDKAFSN